MEQKRVSVAQSSQFWTCFHIPGTVVLGKYGASDALDDYTEVKTMTTEV
jgi:hypothetical protein